MTMDEYQILIVDDDPRQLKILTGHLIEFDPNYRLLIATNGKAGVEISLKNKPDLILMDWEMPVMNGLDAIKALKANEETRMIPIIMVTGTHGEPEKLKEVLEAGAIDFVTKPYNSVELLARIGTQISQINAFRRLIRQQEIINNQEKELISRETQLLHERIEHQNKQLAMQTMNMVQHSELIQSIINDINSLKPFTSGDGKSMITSLASKLNGGGNDHFWNEFEVSFEQVHNTFYKNLVKKIPDLTLREKRLCAFLRLNMNTKEISSITFQTTNAIDVAKHRLRKKAGIDTDEGFTSYLMNL